MNNSYKLINLLLLNSLMISFQNCAPQYDNPKSYTSPDGENIVDVTREEQLSNDPDPFWYHISIRDSSQKNPVLPGNIICISTYDEPDVIWKNNDTVRVIFGERFGYSFKEESIKSKQWDDIFVHISLAKDNNNKIK